MNILNDKYIHHQNKNALSGDFKPYNGFKNDKWTPSNEIESKCRKNDRLWKSTETGNVRQRYRLFSWLVFLKDSAYLEQVLNSNCTNSAE